MAIITYPLNGIEYDAAAAETYLCTRSSGVFWEEDNFLASVTGDRKITIGPGLAWIRNDDYKGKSVCSTSNVELTIATADGALPRLDRIVLRFDASKNASEIVVKKGTPASSPVAPAIVRNSLMYELGLYTVRVPAASVSIAESNITNTKGDSTVCGYMSDGVSSGGMTIAGAAEGSLVATDAQGNLVASGVTVAKLGTGATYKLEGTTLYINTL